MPVKNGTIIRINDLLTSVELKFVDDTTKATLTWFINTCLEADVNLENNAELVGFCRYLTVCLTKTEKLLEHIHKKDMQILEVQRQLEGEE